jgi:hypothetical protein
MKGDFKRAKEGLTLEKFISDIVRFGAEQDDNDPNVFHLPNGYYNIDLNPATRVAKIDFFPKDRVN